MKRLFSTSGIRGVYPSEVSPMMGFKLGLILPSIFGNRAVVGFDARVTSRVLEFSLISGLMSASCHVLRVGLVPLPTLAYAVKKSGAKFGVMVTASHNPPEYNGFKVYREGGWEVMPDEEVKIEEMLLRDVDALASWCDVGTYEDYGLALAEYIEDAVEFIVEGSSKPRGEIKAVIDCCNGPASLVTPYIMSRLGVKVITVNSHVDGTFPGREPEPRPDVLVNLGLYVKSLGADIGLAHDGDADRVAVLDNNGNFIFNDRIIAYMAKRAIERGEGKVVITTIDTSRSVSYTHLTLPTKA